MKTSQILIVILIALVAGFGGAKLAGKVGSAPSVKAETAYERVMRTNTLRCGYAYWDGGVMKDPSGQLTGAWVDITNEVAKAMGLKVEWAAEVAWGTESAALKSGKVDAICAGIWQSANKARELAFTRPLNYQGVEMIVKADDNRFGAGFEKANDPAIKMAVVDNDNSDFIAQSDFAKAQRVSLGQMNATDADLMMTVASGKADATFTVPGLFNAFSKTNQGQLKRAAPGHNLRIFGEAFAMDNQDLRLLQTFDVAVQESLNSGAIDRVLDHYGRDYPDLFLKVAKAYQ